MIKNSLISITFLFVLSGRAEMLALSPKFIAAEIQVESGGKTMAIGDNSQAIGVLQIHKSYWKDSIQYDKTIGGKYEDCFKKDYSIKIMTAYLNRFARNAIKNNDFETLARCHNAGCNWRNKIKETNGYWAKVKKQLKI